MEKYRHPVRLIRYLSLSQHPCSRACYISGIMKYELTPRIFGEEIFGAGASTLTESLSKTFLDLTLEGLLLDLCSFQSARTHSETDSPSPNVRGIDARRRMITSREKRIPRRSGGFANVALGTCANAAGEVIQVGWNYDYLRRETTQPDDISLRFRPSRAPLSSPLYFYNCHDSKNPIRRPLTRLPECTRGSLSRWASPATAGSRA